MDEQHVDMKTAIVTAIVIADIPNTQDADANRLKWSEFLERIRRNGEMPTGSERMTGNVWQIPLDNGLPFLSRLFQIAEENKISIRALILDEPPAWIKHPSST